MTFFGFPKVKWLQYTGKVGKCTSYRCQIFSGFNVTKIIKIGYFFPRPHMTYIVLVGR